MRDRLVGRENPPWQKCPAGFFMSMDGRYADNAGAVVGDAMDGRYAGNAGAIAGDGHGTHGTHAMRIPSMDGRYAGNAGAIAGDGHGTHGTHAMRIPSMDGRYAGNAGAIAGDAMDGRYADNAGAVVGDAMDGRYACNAGAIAGDDHAWSRQRRARPVRPEHVETGLPGTLIPFMVRQAHHERILGAHHERILLDSRCLKYATQLDCAERRYAGNEGAIAGDGQG